jgi:DNA-binding XRE family transcriptional regulator
MDDPLKADTPGKRIKWLRQKAGYKTGTAAAQAFGWKLSTYLGHENGDRKPSLQAAKKYGAAFRAPWVWITDGGELPPPGPPKVFVSYRRDDPASKELIDLLMDRIYDPADMPKGSPEDEAVFTLVRYLRKKAP